MEVQEFIKICNANGISLDNEQISTIERYCDELKYWNEKVNLISRKDIDHILDRHILHSLTILKYVSIFDNANCLDIGTGGGLPGIPLKIAKTTINLSMIDSIAKKVNITRQIVEKLGIGNVRVINDRTENLALKKEYLHNFDFIFARGVASADKITEWSIPLLKRKGKIILLKGGDLSEEIKIAKQIMPTFSFKEIQIDLIDFDYFLKEEKKILVISPK
ncbi:MAG: 16S rRNA (guanine(527)-N(7))-methyltransferase RsmG [Chloroherpetonaceae bacterium]